MSPTAALYQMTGCHFCVPFTWPDDIERVHDIGQSVMIDNGAYGAWKSGKTPSWPKYYEFVNPWLNFPTTWAVVPDLIDASAEAQDSLIAQWPHEKSRSAPVWHMNEPIARLLQLIEDGWSRVCIGSTSQYATVLSPVWISRMDETWNEITQTFTRTPPIHMLRGMRLCKHYWPFASMDSTDVAKNHFLERNTIRGMVERWDRIQCPGTWTPKSVQTTLGLEELDAEQDAKTG
jgi:hypothetical protein